ncbi:1,4-alpha-glucan branching protein GlgB (plasmid) [Paracoccus versutus]|uniref:1,4-alpha-glucan branching enzyme GlgB n=1 Tax=Paracoccus versutus TaxID=34007 RepID=A0AAQ0KLM6_PARVE|nr:1,4-alpha-glucan branching protein GlgB [Paracoccus versutus]KGJ10994.1 glycogen branching protein [Paracoccus versutus]REG47042.1 1,4-alpha-glucan branching enzyme [Paracoccus versutus]WEJ82187.1 1,4-alpha-glucan branching protein GlgB [Paracoccus versutus]
MAQIDPDDIADPAVLSRIAEGRFDDPFAVLGPHPRGGTRHVTAFDPGAQEMAAMAGGKAHPLDPVEGYPGLFHGMVPGAEPYLLRGRRDGEEWLVEDAYRFGPVLGELDEYLLGEGRHHGLWQALGAHVIEHQGTAGTHFAVWAPNARRVSLIGDFNAWDGRRHVMRRRGATGVWEIFMPGLGDGTAYKYEILGAYGGLAQKADPVGFGAQHPPATASVVRDIAGYGWSDHGWMGTRAEAQRIDRPISIYEVHLGSWRRKDGGRPISYREAAVELVDYAKDMGFTHIELLPISEYPFDGSWGYQPVGLFAPTIRFGPPHEFRDLVNAAHKAGLGVILDWVPGHFPTDPHGLVQFDGTALYEHADPREGFHQDWNTLIYNYGRAEVMNYLTANALYWLREYHLDGLRVDAVASMLYRDYSRAEGQWIPNKDGGRENYEAIAMLQAMNRLTYGEEPGIMTVAEESTSYPRVSRPVHEGGLGFGFKWNMGWMNDTLDYIKREPIHRKHHHHQMTFGLHYAFSENFILPISHDEVVHGKGSMLAKMPGSEWEKFANLRAYYGFMWGHPGKKLLFMGQEFAQGSEWNHDAEIDWACIGNPLHYGMQLLVRDLNAIYRATPALYAHDCDGAGFQWIEADDAAHSIYAWVRRGGPGDAEVVVVCNFTPVERSGWRMGFPQPGLWREVLNSDAEVYGGAGRGNLGRVTALPGESHGQPAHADLVLPPLSTLIFIKDDRTTS